MSEHLDTLQIDDTFQTLLGILRLLPAAAALADADEAADQNQSSDDSNGNDGPERN